MCKRYLVQRGMPSGPVIGGQVSPRSRTLSLRVLGFEVRLPMRQERCDAFPATR